MCGIVGYIGQQQAAPLIVNGLKRLEYRGYDSAGVCIVSSDGLTIGKKAGKVSELEKAFLPDTIPGMVGVGHTRWATHGAPNDINAHPHTDRDGAIALVHNGIIENYVTIRKKLVSAGYDTFRSETDSEVLAFFIGMLYETLGDLELSVRTALSEVEGTFGLVVVSSHEPGTIIAARRGSPLVLGVGDGEYLVASDAAAIVAHTRQVVYLHDNEMAILKRDGYITKTIENEVTESVVERIDIDLADIEKGGFPHFMLKEIYEQPDTFHDGFRGRLQIQDGNVRLGGLAAVTDKLRNARRIIITACGTSWHAGLVGEYLIEQMARVPVEVEYASEFRYREPVLGPETLVVSVSQSGETADTLAALRYAAGKVAKVLAIVNVPTSSIAREADVALPILAGVEVGVASTKAFTCQLHVLLLLALQAARQRGRIDDEALTRHLADLAALPGLMNQALSREPSIAVAAAAVAEAQDVLFLGRGAMFPLALEGAPASKAWRRRSAPRECRCPRAPRRAPRDRGHQAPRASPSPDR